MINNLTFLYEENGYIVSKLQVLGTTFFIVVQKSTGKRFIRKSLQVVDEIVRKKEI